MWNNLLHVFCYVMSFKTTVKNSNKLTINEKTIGDIYNTNSNSNYIPMYGFETVSEYLELLITAALGRPVVPEV